MSKNKEIIEIILKERKNKKFRRKYWPVKLDAAQDLSTTGKEENEEFPLIWQIRP